MLFAQILVYSSIVYMLIGVVFAVYFVTARVGAFDESAKGAGIGFRFLIFFGAAAFWSVLLWRLVRGAGPVIETNSHRRAAERIDD